MTKCDEMVSETQKNNEDDKLSDERTSVLDIINRCKMHSDNIHKTVENYLCKIYHKSSRFDVSLKECMNVEMLSA